MLTLNYYRTPLHQPARRVVPYRPGATMRSYLGAIPDGLVGMVGMTRRLRGAELEGFRPTDGTSIDLVMAPGAVAIAVALASFIIQGGIEVLTAPDPPKRPRPLEEEPILRDPEAINAAGRHVPMVMGTFRVGMLAFEQSKVKEYDVKPLTPDANPNREPISSAFGVEKTERILGETETVQMRGALAHGPAAIYDVEVDGNTVDELRGAEFYVRPGLIGIGGNGHAPPDFSRTVNQIDVNLPVTNAGGSVVSQGVGIADQIEVILKFPNGLHDSLPFQPARVGFGTPHDIGIRVEFRQKTAAASWVTAFDGTVSGQRRGEIRFRILLNRLEEAVYEVRVTKTSADDSFEGAGGGSDDLEWESWSEWLSQERNHPQLAYIGVKDVPVLEAEREKNLRNITATVDAPQNVEVYTDPNTFTEGFSASPPWLLRNYLLRRIDGLGRWFDAGDIDIEAWLDWSNHCKALVDNGAGVFETRCEFDHAYLSPTPAKAIIRDIGTAGDADVVRRGGKWTVVVDRPRPITRVFQESHVIGSPSIGWIPRKDRPSQIQARFQNRDKSHRLDSFTDEDPDLTGEDHVKDVIDVVGITRVTQLQRYLRRRINRNKLETRTLVAELGLEALPVNAGARIAFALPGLGTGVSTGRITRVSGAFFDIDDLAALDPGEFWQVHITTAGGQQRTFELVNVNQSDFRFEVLDAESFSGVAAGDAYAIGKLDSWVVQSITLRDDYRRRLECRLYDSRTYDPAIVKPEVPTAPDPGNPNKAPPQVENLTLIKVNTQQVDVAWSPPPDSAFISEYEVFRREDGQTWWTFTARTRDLQVALDSGFAAGKTYDVAVRAVSPTGWRLAVEDSTSASIAL